MNLWRRLAPLVQLTGQDTRMLLLLVGRWLILGSLVGVLAGSASALFLITLDWATQTRGAQPWLLYGLPLAGLAVGWAYHRFAGPAAAGNHLVIDEVNQDRAQIPLRMAPMVLLGTVITHLFGGSAGREGTAIQMGASLADALQRWLRLDRADRRLMLMAGISGGFGSVFGVPVAGFVFGMEVQRVGVIRYAGLIPCLSAAISGDLVTRAWGAPHSHYPHLPTVANEPILLGKVLLAGAVFGLISLLFVELTHGIKQLAQRLIAWPPLRPLVGGLLVLGLTWLVGSTDYLGLSLPLIQASVNGETIVPAAFLLKLIFTAVTLGTGFLGGEVTPLFVIGSTLGATLGAWLGVDPALLAAIGLVAVFAGASNTPLACTLMGIELFGSGAALYFLIGCTVAYLVSGHRGIYGSQILGEAKTINHVLHPGETLDGWRKRRHDQRGEYSAPDKESTRRSDS